MEKIEIPLELQDICKALGKVAQEKGLRRLSGKFDPASFSNWGGEISFLWEAGRHNEDTNDISITSQFFVHTKIKD